MRTLFLIVMGMAFGTAHAQSYLSPNPPPNAVEDRFRLELDLFRGSYDTVIRIDNVITNVGGVTTVIPGTEISAEKDLGLAETQYLGQLELTLLPGKHHMVRLSGLSMRREGSVVLERTIIWDNAVYRVGDRVDSHLNFTMVGLTYAYLPLRTDRYELGLSFGVQIASVGANAEARTQPPRHEQSGSGPIPLIGAEGRYDFTPRWSIDARVQYLSLSLIQSLGVDVNDVDGTITDWRVAIRWRQNQHFIYGLGYRHFDLDVTSPTTKPAGLVGLGLKGPILFVQASL